MKKVLFLSFCILLMFSCTERATFPESTALNLDFETPVYGINAPDKWILGGRGYESKLDSMTKQSGKTSLRITYKGRFDNDFGVFTGLIPIDSVKGKKVKLSGYIKTEDVKDGYAGLWLRVNGGELEDYKILSFDNMHDRGIKDSTDWTQVNIEMDIDLAAKAVVFGGLLVGTGTAWYDNLEITIDGKKYEDIVIPAPKTELTKSEKQEFKKYIYPLRTYEPDGGNTKDLEILNQLIGESKVVALGEVTHGSSEIFKMKNRMIQYLAQNKGFDIFSIEANMPESYKLNEYTIKGKGNPKSLIDGMYFWTWNTEEVLNMVEWMKTYNQGQSKISFTGFDMQFYEGSIRELKETFLGEEKTFSKIRELGAVLNAIKEKAMDNYAYRSEEDKNKVTNLLSSIKKDINDSSLDDFEKVWAHQNIRIIEQYMMNTSYLWRDQCMAENLLWIKEQNPSSKIVAWAHNGHIMKDRKMMGEHLADSLKNDYVTFGFTFFEGHYTASGKDGLTGYKAQSAYPGTLEYILNLMDEPIFILDMKKIKSEGTESLRFIKEGPKFRGVGAVQMDNEFYKLNTFDHFDYLIFIKDSTPSQLLK